MALKDGTKTGGRKKGTPNKVTQDLFALCEKRGIDVFNELLSLCKDSDKTIRLNAINSAARYLYPVRRAVEVSGIDGQPIKNESSFSPESKQILDELKSTLDNLASERRAKG